MTEGRTGRLSAIASPGTSTPTSSWGRRTAGRCSGRLTSGPTVRKVLAYPRTPSGFANLTLYAARAGARRLGTVVGRLHRLRA